MIDFRHITKSFGKKRVLHNFNLKVEKGEKVIIYGKSGGGKSTILKMLMGFEKPDSGQIYFGNDPVDESTVWEVRKSVSYVSQDTDIGEGPVNSLIEEICSYHSNQGRTCHPAMLRLFRLNKAILDKNIEDLSGGERQRVAILVSLMLDRKVLLLDEVTSALDSRLKDRVVDFFLSKEWTVIAISHDDSWFRPGTRKVKV